MKLKDKVAIVTGAGTGMGKSVALRYAREGAKVVIAELNTDFGEETLAAIKGEGGEAIFIPVDVRIEAEVIQLVAKAIERYGSVNVLYNNVARMHKLDAKVHELSSEVWHELITVNLNSAFYCCKHVIIEMLRSGKGGSIILVGSPTALIACASSDAAYSCTKSGVHTLARVIADAYGKADIRANIVIPGTMETPMIEDILNSGETKANLEGASMLGRLGKSSDVDGLAVFLASDESAYCTGAFFTVDGGLTAK